MVPPPPPPPPPPPTAPPAPSPPPPPTPCPPSPSVPLQRVARRFSVPPEHILFRDHLSQLIPLSTPLADIPGPCCFVQIKDMMGTVTTWQLALARSSASATGLPPAVVGATGVA